MLKDERDQLKDVDSFVIIEYIKSSIEILLSLKLEEQEKELKKGKLFYIYMIMANSFYSLYYINISGALNNKIS